MVQAIPGSELPWRVNARPPTITSFAVSLNELEKGMEKTLPPTDCRLCPDIRGTELGNKDLGSQEKKRLEEKQREAPRERAKEELQRRWFRQGSNPYTEAPAWQYSGGYFERSFSHCPDVSRGLECPSGPGAWEAGPHEATPGPLHTAGSRR